MTPMTAGDVRAALFRKWPASEYAHVNEAPQDPARQGRKIDVLVLSQWASRGHELDAVEVKVSASDWKRELDRADKADWWWRHCNRFWVAVPDEPKLVERVKGELPDTWGLLACTPEAVRAVVKAPKHEREPLGWPTVVGLLRAAVDCGPNILLREYQRGLTDGRKRGAEEVQRRSADGVLRDENARLKKLIDEFEQASGIALSRAWSGGDIGRYVALARKAIGDPDFVARNIDSIAHQLGNQTRQVEALARACRDLATPPAEQGAA